MSKQMAFIPRLGCQAPSMCKLIPAHTWFLLHFLLRIYFYMHQKFLCICVRLQRINQYPAPGMFFSGTGKTENTFRSNMSQLCAFFVQFCKHCLERLGSCEVSLNCVIFSPNFSPNKGWLELHTLLNNMSVFTTTGRNITLCYVIYFSTLYNNLNYFSTCSWVTIQISVILGLEGEDSYSLVSRASLNVQ